MHDESQIENETLQHERVVNYLCSCGGEVQLPVRGAGTCGKCGRRVSLEGLDPTQTVSFCGEQGSGTSFHLTDGPDRSGEQLGHFRLLSKLGFGGMGAVYRAQDESLQRFVAVKVIRTQTGDGSAPRKQVTRLLDEAVAQARLNHPNVVTIYYVGRNSDDPFFAMELLPGPTLAYQIRHEPLTYRKIIMFARQVVSALRQASVLGLVHGDIKPSNLILADENTVKLSDFGLAVTGTTSPVQGISGTLNYMAPELSSGSDPSDQSDMYALGVTLFELTFGRRPYTLSGTTLREKISSQQGSEVEFPEKWPRSIPERWKLVLERLMARQPADRYADYDELANELEKLAPVGVTSAGLLNRGLAWGVDLLLQSTLMLPFTLVAALSSTQGISLPPVLSNITHNFAWLGLLAPIVPAAFTWTEWRGWRTFGRYLFQLRVADEHGLWLGRRRRVLRSMIRNLPIWASALGTMIISLGWNEIAIILMPLDDLVLLVNIIPILGPRRLAVHDRLLRSHVVLDTRAQEHQNPV
ncbi:MAG: protein kinase [Pirellulaceae bacterium]